MTKVPNEWIKLDGLAPLIADPAPLKLKLKAKSTHSTKSPYILNQFYNLDVLGDLESTKNMTECTISNHQGVVHHEDIFKKDDLINGIINN